MNKGEHLMTLVQTVANNARIYNKRDYWKDVQARKLQNITGRPTTKTFLWYINNNIVYNCTFIRPDILAAEDIFGPDVRDLKGKTTISKTFTIHGGIVNILTQTIERYKNVILSADIMKVN